MSNSLWYPIPRSIRGIYFASNINAEQPLYNTAELLEFSGKVDINLLRRATATVYAENEALRTVFRVESEVQWRALSVEEHLERITCVEDIQLGTQGDAKRAVMDWARHQILQPLEVFKGGGVYSALLECQGSFWFFHEVHHLLADGFAAFDILRRIAEIYRTISGGKELRKVHRTSLADLADADRAESARLSSDFAEWKNYVEQLGIESDSSTAFRGGTSETSTFREYRIISEDLQRRLLDAGRSHSANWATLVTAAIGSYVARAARVEEALCSVPMMNRFGGKESLVRARTACSSVNLLPLRVMAGGTPQNQLEIVLEQLKFIQAHALTRQEEIDRLFDQQGLKKPATQINVVPFDTVFDFGENLRGIAHNVAAGPVDDLTVCVRGLPGRGNTVSLEIDVNSALYSAQQATEHADRILHWIESWVQVLIHEEDVNTLLLGSAKDQALVDSFNRTMHEVDFVAPVRLFEQACKRFPYQIALIEGRQYASSSSSFGNRELLYTEFNSWVKRYAALLASRGVQRGDRVGLRVERGIEQFILLYAVLYLGAVYVPLDPALPLQRVVSMCLDARVKICCEGPGVKPIGGQDIYDVVTWSELEGAEAPTLEQFPGLDLQPEEEVYVLFTSGSTGKPKGVPISAVALHNRLRWQQDALNLEPGERVLHKTPISFDVHVWELYWPLQEGATVVIAAPDGHRDPMYINECLKMNKIDVIHFVPSMLVAFLKSPGVRKVWEEQKPQLRAVISSGEALSPETVADAHTVLEADVFNLYGPTEAAIDVTLFKATLHQKYAEIPMGQPVWNMRMSVHDLAGQPCPVGVVGELHLHGVQVSVGYLNRPDLTAEAFYLDENAEQSYKTGDLVYWDYAGLLHYVGRADHQVKIRGQRVDLGEIETVLSNHESVSNNCVLYFPERGGMLVAFVEFVYQGGCQELQNSLEIFLQEHFPAYMVPTQFVVKENLPLTANGKIDRKLLSGYKLPPETENFYGAESVAEQRMLEIFEEVLACDVGVETDFFSVGGNSLAALQLLSEIEKSWGKRVSLSSVFNNPTPRALARVLEEKNVNDFSPLLVLREGNPDLPLIIFVPPAGGLGWCYLAFLPYLPSNRTVLALQAPPYGGEYCASVSSINELAQIYLSLLQSAELSLPGACLVGWSLGGMIAHDLSALLESQGIMPERTILLDAYPQQYWRTREEPTESELWKAIARMGGLDPQDDQLSQNQVIDLLQNHRTALGQLSKDKLEVCIQQVRQAMRIIRKGKPAFSGVPATVVSASDSRAQGADPQLWYGYSESLDLVNLSAQHIDMVKPEYIVEILKNIPFHGGN